MANLSDQQGAPAKVPTSAWVLGLAGLIPFVTGAVLSVFDSTLGPVQGPVLLTMYGAVILAFLGGCRWGFASAGLGDGPELSPLLISVAPALLGFGSLLLFPPGSLLVLAIGYAMLLIADLSLAREGGAPRWWPVLRSPLSAVAIICLLIGAFL